MEAEAERDAQRCRAEKAEAERDAALAQVAVLLEALEDIECMATIESVPQTDRARTALGRAAPAQEKPR
jgi:hypothetical protein